MNFIKYGRDYMKKKLNFKKLIIDLFSFLLVVLILILGFRYITASPIIFYSGEHEIGINSVVDYSSFIKTVKGGEIQDVQIDASDVKINQLGEYSVVYSFKDKKTHLKVKVIDSTAPKVSVKDLKIAQNQTVIPNDLISKIDDDTKTTVSFEKNYDFSKVGKKEVNIVVEDEGHNKTIASTTIEVVKDVTPPTIIASSFHISLNEKVDLKDYVSIKDDYDSQPKLTVQADGFQTSQIGDYQVKYIAEDSAKNRSEKTITVHVQDKTAQQEKVVYLTFDDGPSLNTPKVLDILAKYNCKATFFVTGMNKNYRDYIAIANSQGHTIGLHTYSHKYNKLYQSVDNYFSDLDKIGQVVKEQIGYVPKYIRFPGGSSNTVSKKYNKGIMTKLSKMVIEKGYKYYDWNAENGDGYSQMSKSEMIRRATSSSKNEIMILMHDANGKQSTVDILPDVIKYYQNRGYQFNAIDEATKGFHQPINN